MSDEKYQHLMDTEGSSCDVTRIITTKEAIRIFEYKTFCREIFQKSKKEIDACFLMPIKLYYDVEDIRKEEMLPILDEWVTKFLQKKSQIKYFWVFLCDMASGGMEYDWHSSELNLKEYNLSSIRLHMNDIGKIEKRKYITKVLKGRENVEYWLLKVYDMTLRNMVSIGNLCSFIENIIQYLNKCGIKIKMPITKKQTFENKDYFYMFASNLMLLVFRCRFGVEKAVEWYYDCNKDYLRYYDWMLEEYIQLVEKHNIQSYERFYQMRKLAQERQNKYASKEVGDIYGCGMLLESECGGHIYIEPDMEKACTYYRISLESSYMPAGIAALKTGALTNEQQRSQLLNMCMAEQNREAYIYNAQQHIITAKKLINIDLQKGLENLEMCAAILTTLDDNYAIKYILKNDILSLIYQATILGADVTISCPNLQTLFSIDILKMDKQIYLNAVEENLLIAGELGYLGAEYSLAKLHEEDKEKYNSYISRGCEKGCERCLLERNRALKSSDPINWVKNLMDIWKNSTSEQLQLEIIKELATYEDVPNYRNDDVKLSVIMAEVYLCIQQGISVVAKPLSTDLNKTTTETINLLARLNNTRRKVMEILKDSLVD